MSALTDLLAALRGAPGSIQSIDAQLVKLYAERDALKKAPPHIDDVVAWAIRGLDNASASALGRLKSWHFNADSLATFSGETFDSHAGPNILALTSGKPHPANSSDPRGVCSPAPSGGAPDADMLVHFLRPVLEPELRKLVAEGFAEGCKGGLKSSERNARLAKVAEKIAALESQRAELERDVREAAKHLDAAKYAAGNAPEQYDGGPVLSINAE
jgi:outer membrane murein-binding lipoprotein Lpp